MSAGLAFALGILVGVVLTLALAFLCAVLLASVQAEDEEA